MRAVLHTMLTAQQQAPRWSNTGRGHVAVAQNILLLLLYNKLAAQKVQLALKHGPVCDGVRRVGDKHQLLQNGRLHFTGQVCQQQLAVGIAVRVHLIAHAGGNVPGLAALYQMCDDDAPVRVQRAEAHGFARGGLKPRPDRARPHRPPSAVRPQGCRSW